MASKHAKYLASGSTLLKICELLSAPQIGLFKQAFNLRKSVTQRHFGGSLPGFIRGNAWLLQLEGSSLGIRIPACTISSNSFWAGRLKCYGISKGFPTFDGGISLVPSRCNLTGGIFTQSNFLILSLNIPACFFNIFLRNSWHSTGILLILSFDETADLSNTAAIF